MPRASSGAVSYDYSISYVGTLPADLSTIKNAPSTWKVTGPDDRVWSVATAAPVNYSTTFDWGVPTQIAWGDGYVWTFAYAGDGRLNTITDTFGRTLSFDWNIFYGMGQGGQGGRLPDPEAVDKITFPDGTSVKYTYDPAPSTSAPSTSQIERLIKVSLRNAGQTIVDSTTYHYENTNYRTALTGITDNRGIRTKTYTYDARGRVIQTKGAANQNQIDIAYGTSGNDLTRTVTNPLGKAAVYRFAPASAGSSDRRLVAIDGQASTNCPASVKAWTYGADGFVATATDEEGRITSFVRDAKGRPTEIYTADGLPEEQKTEITWDANRNLPLTVKRPGLTATRAYNAAGQLTSLTETDTTTHTSPYPTSGQTRVWSYAYGTGGLVASVDGPIAGTGDTEFYTYDAAGNVKTYKNELGQITTVVTVNGRGQPTQVKDANNLVTNLTYDAVGRLLTTVANPGGVAAATTLQYDAAGNVTKLTRPDGSFLQMPMTPTTASPLSPTRMATTSPLPTTAWAKCSPKSTRATMPFFGFPGRRSSTNSAASSR